MLEAEPEVWREWSDDMAAAAPPDELLTELSNAIEAPDDAPAAAPDVLAASTSMDASPLDTSTSLMVTAFDDDDAAACENTTTLFSLCPTP